jgi:hypothetical protein
MNIKAIALATAAVLAVGSSAHAAATLVASYGFDNTLTSGVGGPALVAVDPTGTSGFITDTVNSVSRTVYHVGGSTPPLQQGGLTFDTSGLLTAGDGYSVEMTFEFTDATRDNTWRRILDSQDRLSDSGFYADPSNNIDVFPNGGSSANFLAGTYRNVVLTVDGSNNVKAYIDGFGAFSAVSTSMNISTNVLGLFLDNTAGGGQGEWSATNIATFNVFDGVLTADQADAFDGQSFTPPGVPEPASWAMMLAGFGGLGALMRRRRAQATFA